MIPDEIKLPDHITSAELVADRRGSRIWRATLADSRVVAVKYATDDGPQRDARLLAAREAAVLRQLGADDYLHASGETEAGTWLAVTWLDAPTLLDRWKPARDSDGPDTRRPALVATWLAADTLAGLHAHGWRHADLQAAHIYVPDMGQAQLIDLALAQGPEQTTPEITYRGGLAHLTAPEVASEILATPAEHHVAVTPAAEVYMFGAVLFAVWTKQWPCDYGTGDTRRLTVPQIHATICNPNSRRPLPNGWPQMRDLLSAMLSHDAEDRPTMAEVRSSLGSQLGGQP